MMAFSFGQPSSAAAPSTGFTFGASAPATATTVGSSAPSTGGFTFGLAPVTTSGGAPTSTQAAAGLGVGFGTGTGTAVGTGFQFSTPASTTTAGTAAPTLGTGFAFGAQQPAISAAIRPTLSLAPPAQSTASLFGGLGQQQQTSGLFSSLNKPTAPATTGSLKLGILGNSGTTSGSGGFGLNLGSIATTSSGLSVVTTADAPGAATAVPASEVKNNTLPAELNAAVEEFKKFLNEQHDLCESVSGRGVDELMNVSGQIKQLRAAVSLVHANNQRDHVQVQKVKVETQQELRHIDLAVRCRESMSLCSGVQSTVAPGAGTTQTTAHHTPQPHVYFIEMIEYLELMLLSCKDQLSHVDRQITSRRQSAMPLHPSNKDLHSSLITSRELLISLAAELYDIHEVIKKLKEDYLYHRRTHLSDTTDIFQSAGVTPRPQLLRTQGLSLPPPATAALSSLYGPSPFTRTDTDLASLTMAMQHQARASTGIAGSIGGVLGGTTGSIFGQIGAPGTSTNVFGGAAGSFGAAPAAFLSTTGQPIRLGQPPAARSKKGRR